jgi:hypothetical protein
VLHVYPQQQQGRQPIDGLVGALSRHTSSLPSGLACTYGRLFSCKLAELVPCFSLLG